MADSRETHTYYLHLTLVRHFCTWLGGVIFNTVLDIRTTGVDRLPPHGPVILAPNHLTGFDIIPLQLSLPRPFFPMAKSELFQHPALGWFFRQLGAFPIKRGLADLWAMTHAAKVLEAGQVLCIFPEGTRTRGRGLVAGKTGAAYLALKHNAPVVPIGIAGTDRLFKPWHRRSRVNIAVGEPLWPAVNEPTEAFTERLMLALARLLPPEYRGVYAERVEG